MNELQVTGCTEFSVVSLVGRARLRSPIPAPERAAYSDRPVPISLQPHLRKDGADSSLKTTAFKGSVGLLLGNRCGRRRIPTQSEFDGGAQGIRAVSP